MVLIPAQKPLEVVFAFDTTGPTYRCLKQVRARISQMVQHLQRDIPGIKTAFINLCDYNVYVTNWVGVANNTTTTTSIEQWNFLNKAERTSRDSRPDCYTLVLNQARCQVPWIGVSSRPVLVLIADSEFHEAQNSLAKGDNTKDMEKWEFEARELDKLGVPIYTVQCGEYHGDVATTVYKTLASLTGGKHLKLTFIEHLFDVLMAVCYYNHNDEAKLESHEKEAKARCDYSAHVARDIDAIFTSLRNDDAIFTSLRNDDADMTSLDVSPMDVTTTTTTLSHTHTSDAVSSASPSPLPSAKLIANATITKKTRVPTTTRLPLKSPLRRKGKSAIPAAAASKVYPKTKRTRTLSDVLRMYKDDNLSLLKRENVPNTNFKLGNLKWSPWKLVLSPELPAATATHSTKQWVERRDGRHGYRLRTLRPRRLSRHHLRKDFNNNNNGKSVVLFEVSVQTPQEHNRLRSRHNVVYSSFSKRCFDNNTQWETYLLSRVGDQVDRLLSDGCKIFMRFYELSPRDDISKLKSGLKRYDYAWKPIRNVRNKPRLFTRGDHCISSS